MRSGFYFCGGKSDGYLKKCKKCICEDVKKNRKKNAEYYREFDRKRAMQPKRVTARADYLKTKKGTEVARKAKKKWILKNKEKRRAHWILWDQIKHGKIVPQPCWCGRKAHAHHDDYDKPLDVKWLCPKHHTEEHRKIKSFLK